MYLLFIDLETNGLNPFNDNILEIGAVLMKFNNITLGLEVVSHFQSLIWPRQALNSTSSRITGLGSLEFADAPKLFQAQEQWLTWLDSVIPQGLEVTLCGHSIIDFDLKFLEYEKWFLPLKYSVIDTLPLSRILLPFCQAINLEHLIEKLELKPQIQKFCKQISLESSSHRALYDCICDIELLRKLLQLLSQYKFPASILKSLQKNLLKLDLNLLFLGAKDWNDFTNSNASGVPNSNEIQALNWKYEPITNNLKTQILSTDFNLNKILLEIDNYPEQLRNVALQIFFIKYLSKYFKGEQLYFHGRDGENKLAKLLLKYGTVKPKSQSLETHGQLPLLENLLWEISTICEERLILDHLIQILELLICSEFELTKSLTITIQQFLASYDFWLLAMQPFWQYHQYIYLPNKMTVVEDKIYKKFNSFCKNLEILKTELENLETENEIVIFLKKEFLNSINNFEVLDPDNSYTFVQVKDQIQIVVTKKDFNIQKYFEEILSFETTFLIPTYTNPEEIFGWMQLFDLNSISQQITGRIEFRSEAISNPKVIFENVSLDTNYLLQILAGESNLPTLILAGDNQSLIRLEKICTQELNSSQYMILGESGSKTKIISKLAKQFSGVVVLKQSDLGYLLNFQSQLKFEQIIFVKTPYLNINNFWKQKWGQKYEQNYKIALSLYLKSRMRQAAKLI